MRRFAFIVAAERELHFAAFFAEEDVAALDLGELEGGVEQCGEDLVDGVGGVELAGRFEEPAQLVEGVAGGVDFGDLLDDVADGGGVAEDFAAGVFGADAEAGAVECAEVDDVAAADGLAGGSGLAVDKGAVAAGLIGNEAAAAFKDEVGMAAGDERMGEDEVVLRQAANGEGRVRDGNGAPGGAVGEE